MTTNPIRNGGLPPPTPVSRRTIAMTGILVDVYGLEELPSGGGPVSCLWLHNPRKASKEDMADIAHRAVGAWNARTTEPAAPASSERRGLIALAFDQRNHGSRTVHELASLAWREGNETHAQDMLGIISGTVVDQRLLLDAVAGYLFVQSESGGAGPGRRTVDQHLALGISLGGHSVWQTMFTEPRFEAGVVVIGCPDMQALLMDRARLSRRSTFDAADNGASFLGSTDFPEALVQSTAKFDPKAMIFGTGPVATDAGDAQHRALLEERLRGKKFLLCSGAEDKLVPYCFTQPFAEWLGRAAAGIPEDGRFNLEDKVYPGAGHEFSAAMIHDSVRFIVGIVAGASSKSGEAKTSKI